MKTFNNWAMACAVALAVGSAAAAQSSGAEQTGSSGQAGTMGGAGTSSQSGSTDDRGAQAGRENSQGDLQKFVQKAAISNMAEIELGQLAQQKAQNPDVKQFAQSMVDEHQKANDQLKQAADAAGIMVPTSLDEKHQKLHAKLSNLNGSDFDREYMKLMVKAHDETRKLLEQRAGKSNANASSEGSGSDVGGAAAGTGTSGSTGTSGAAGTSGTSGSTAGSSGTTAAGTSSSSGAETTGRSTTGVSSASGAAAIDAWAAGTLPNVQHHLQMAKDLEKRVKDEGKNDKNGRSDK